MLTTTTTATICTHMRLGAAPCPKCAPETPAVDFDENADDTVYCPHCDGEFHAPSAHCWCIGCESCVAAREAAASQKAQFRAAMAEQAARHEQQVLAARAAREADPSWEEEPF